MGLMDVMKSRAPKSRCVTSTLVAQEFLNLADQDKESLTPLQLIKMTYIAHGWAFVNFSRGLVDEEVEAWLHGPVFPDLYRSLKSYGGGPVDKVRPSDLQRRHPATELEPEERELIAAVYEGYKNYNGIDLTKMTHRRATPWDKAWNERECRVIKESWIKEYYTKLAGPGHGADTQRSYPLSAENPPETLVGAGFRRLQGDLWPRAPGNQSCSVHTGRFSFPDP